MLEREGVLDAPLAVAMALDSPGDSLIAEAHREHNATVAAAPRLRISRKTSSSAVSPSPVDDGVWLEAALTVAMDIPFTPPLETPPEHGIPMEVKSARVASAPPVLVPGEEVWRRFTPSLIDPARCLSRTYNGGAGGQCSRYPKAGEVICGSCKKLAHGRVDGPIRDGKLQIFLRSSRGV